MTIGNKWTQFMASDGTCPYLPTMEAHDVRGAVPANHWVVFLPLSYHLVTASSTLWSANIGFCIICSFQSFKHGQGVLGPSAFP